MPRPVSTFRVTLVTTAASLAVWGGFALSGWPGQGNGCFTRDLPMCFCETSRPGPVAQPANTFSNLGFIVVGLALAWAVDRGRLYAGRRNPLTATRLSPALFTVVIAFLGPGSMFLHASQTVWGHRVDLASMYLLVCLMIAYAVLRLRALSLPAFVALFAALSALCTATTFIPGVPDEAVFGVLLVSTIALELHLARSRPRVRRESRWITAAVVLFLAAFAVWIPSLSGGALCDPHGLLQGHAAWHLLCAASAGCIFAYLRSEHDPDGPEPLAPDGPTG